jgi:hypothetical protein
VEIDKQTFEATGIGGGYSQFGILTEEEFIRVLKGDGKKIRKFTEHPDQFKEEYAKACRIAADPHWRPEEGREGVKD